MKSCEPLRDSRRRYAGSVVLAARTPLSQSLRRESLKVVGEAAASLRGPNSPPSGNPLDILTQEEEEVLSKHWPKGRPTGDGNAYFDQVMKMRVRRLGWKSRIETGGELVWLMGKLGGIVVCLGIAWENLVR